MHASERNRLTRGFPEFYNSPSILDEISTMSCESKNKNFYAISKTQILIVLKALVFCAFCSQYYKIIVMKITRQIRNVQPELWEKGEL